MPFNFRKNRSQVISYFFHQKKFSSRANVDYYVGSGRLSRVDSYVRDIHTPYEYEVPSTYERYRSSSRPASGYSSINGYTVSDSSYMVQLKHLTLGETGDIGDHIPIL